MEIWCSEFVNVDSTTFYFLLSFPFLQVFFISFWNRLTYARNIEKVLSICKVVYLSIDGTNMAIEQMQQMPWQIVNFSCRNIQRDIHEMCFISISRSIKYRLESISENTEIECQVEYCIVTGDGSGFAKCAAANEFCFIFRQFLMLNEWLKKWLKEKLLNSSYKS